MPRIMHRRSRKAGLPPGTPVHIGERKHAETRVQLIEYGPDALQERAASLDECLAARGRPGVVWINVEGVHDVALLERLGAGFGLHPLVIEDIANTAQRPKFEDYGEYLYIVLRMLSLRPESTAVVSEQLSLILGPDFVLCFQEGLEGDVFNPVRERLRLGRGRLRQAGADFLAYSLIDTIVDSYFAILERFGERIEELDGRLAGERTAEVSRPIHVLKREMIWLRKSVWPLREMLAGLQRRESPLVREATGVYLKDVYDHTVEIIETVEVYRDVLSGMLENHLSLLTTRLNEVMKVLTGIATIFIPLSFITGVYGMNFRYMPELEWRWSYPLAMLGMAVIGVGLYVYFRRRRWL